MPTCRLIIRDEVNVKLEGLDVSLRKKLVNQFKFSDPKARYTPAVRLGRWDGKIAFFQLGGSSYINLLPEILATVEDAGYDIDVEDQRAYRTQFNFNAVNELSYSDRTWPQGHPQAGQPIKLRDYQVEIINNFLTNPQCLQEIATGAGKCQPLTSKVLTPTGWRLMADINVGDSVITPEGRAVKVLGVFTPGIKDVYELTFTDGRTARSCGDHIWRVYNIDWKRSKTGPWRNISTQEIVQLKNNSKRSIGIPLVKMTEDTTDIDLPMDPWLMGFLLGDGSFRNGNLTFSTADRELVDKVASKLGSDYAVKHIGNYDYCIKFATAEIKNELHGNNMRSKIRNSTGHILPGQSSTANKYKQILKDVGLDKLSSHDKFIPEIYFSGSLEQRLEMIRGLVDSDGTIDKGSVYFTSTSSQLSKDFQRMVRSVGGIAKLKNSTGRTYLYNGIRKPCRDAFIVATKYPRPWELVSLKRKRDKTGYSYQYGETLKLNIESVDKVSTEEVKCLLIDDPAHLYVTDDYIVTHNTLITAVLSHRCEPYGRTMVIVPNKSLVTQTEADYRNMGLDVGVYFGDRKEQGRQHTICTWQSLARLLKDTQSGEADITFGDFVDGVVCVIVDEAHGAKADALKSILTGVLAHLPIRWGLTGTIPKEDFEFYALRCGIGEVVNRISASELQDRGVLANCHVNIRQMVEYGEYKTYQTELKYLLEDQDRMTFIAKQIEGIRGSGNTLVLIDRVSAGRALTALIPDAVFVNGATKSDVRQEHYADVATSEDKVIVATYGVAAVGINIPRIFNLVLVEPGKSFVRVIQSIGRGIRRAQDKDFVQIWDYTSTCKFSKRHLTKRKQFYRDANYPFTIEKIEWR